MRLLLGLAFIGFIIFCIFEKPFEKGRGKFFTHFAYFFDYTYKKCIVYASCNVKIEDLYDILPYNFSYPLMCINIYNIEKKLREKSWVAFCSVHRVFPDAIFIKVLEKNAIALWKNKEKEFVIDELGNTFESILTIDQMQNLPCVIGDGANLCANKLINDIQKNKFLKDKVYCGVYIGNRRWDIILKDGTLIKMPENNFFDAWNQAASLLEKQSDISDKNGIEVIDLRNENKIYIKMR